LSARNIYDIDAQLNKSRAVAYRSKRRNEGKYGMKVKIDYDLCMGDRNCSKVCPEVFQYDEDQLLSRVIVDEVPKNLEELVRKAAEECAPGAILIEE
jgi:ferredoxin